MSWRLFVFLPHIANIFTFFCNYTLITAIKLDDLLPSQSIVHTAVPPIVIFLCFFTITFTPHSLFLSVFFLAVVSLHNLQTTKKVEKKSWKKSRVKKDGVMVCEDFSLVIFRRFSSFFGVFLQLCRGSQQVVVEFLSISIGSFHTHLTWLKEFFFFFKKIKNFGLYSHSFLFTTWRINPANFVAKTKCRLANPVKGEPLKRRPICPSVANERKSHSDVNKGESVVGLMEIEYEKGLATWAYWAFWIQGAAEELRVF